MDTDEILHVMKHVTNLKEVKRAGWIRENIPNPESDADHSYGVAMLALLLAKAEGFNEEKITKMGLVHELCESIVGDATPYDKDTPEKKAAVKDGELRAIRQILKGELLALAEEEHAQETPEAKLVKEADMLEMCFQTLAYELREKKNLDEFWEYATPKITTATGKEVLARLRAQR